MVAPIKGLKFTTFVWSKHIAWSGRVAVQNDVAWTRSSCSHCVGHNGAEASTDGAEVINQSSRVDVLHRVSAYVHLLHH